MISATKDLVCVQFRLLSAFTLLLYSIYNAFINLFFGNISPKKIPRTENEIFRKSATQLAIDIRTKKISCVSVISEFIQRQKAVNPIINAIVDDRYQEAMQEAQEVDNFLSQTKLTEAEIAHSKPLLGVPVSIKESIAVKGLNLVVGAKDRIGMKAEEDGESVRRFVNAGAIVLCVTTTPELCLSTETNNLVTGKTNNPYNVLYTCGGSSGGEGALVSSSGSVIGLGSDIAGSIRIPAAFCGIFGHKPTTGVVDLTGHIPLLDDPVVKKHLLIGPLARYAEDLLLITKIITNNNPKLKLDDPVKLSNLKLHYMVDGGSCFGSMEVHKKIKQRIRESVAHFSKTFDCDISDIKFDEVQYTPEAHTALFLSIEDDAQPEVNLIVQFIKAIFGKSDYSMARLFYYFLKNDRFLLPKNVLRMKDFVNYLEKKFNSELSDNGVFFYPVFPSCAFRHGSSIFTSSAISYPALANILGLPATTVPVGFIENGMPIAIQVIAGRNQDRLCFAVAKELEKHFGGWMPPY